MDARDLAAMVVDLVLRGWFVAEQRDGAWILKRPGKPPESDARTVAERRLERALFASSASVDLAHPMGVRLGDPSQVRVALREQAVEDGWYRRDPQPDGVRRLAGRVPRTALGTAVRVQTLGFRRYLATAKADQISFEEAAGEFSRYLSWALVFGLAKQWTRVMREVGRRAAMEDAALVTADGVLDPFALHALFQLGEFAAMGAGELAEGLFSEDGLLALGEGAGLFGDLFDTVVEAVGEFDFTDLFG